MEALLALTALAWLVPNHYAPWSSAWGEGMAAAGCILALAYIVIRDRALRPRVSKPLFFTALICWVSIVAQLISGRLIFFGDAVMAGFYVGLWAAAVVLGRYLSSPKRQSMSDALALIWVIGAVLSTGVALVQWTSAFSLGIYGVDLPPGARPFGNVAQPNHLCTLTFIGLCGAVWCYQKQFFGRFSFWVAASFLLFGMALSQSRTGWLQIAWFSFFLIVFQNGICIRLKRLEIFSMVLIFYFSALNIERFSEWLLLPGARTLAEQMHSGVRLPYWGAMVDAVLREPFWGYGWQQVGLAQENVALNHAGFGSLFEHAHNFFLDLLLWNGLIFGGAIIFCLLLWLWRSKSAAVDRRVFWFVMALGGIFIHAMLEFPLEYSYFLIPAGIAMGVMDSANLRDFKYFYISRSLLFLSVAVLISVFLAIFWDYFKAEESYRQLRMESARIGSDKISSSAPQLLILDQLEGFLKFARTEAKAGMSDEDLNFMRVVFQRFPYPPVMFRYALAEGINGKPEVARITLEKLCKIHDAQRCEEASEGWVFLKEKYPELEAVKWRW